jgi:hypothetical protein
LILDTRYANVFVYDPCSTDLPSAGVSDRYAYGFS